jgi:hypothetical protein
MSAQRENRALPSQMRRPGFGSLTPARRYVKKGIYGEKGHL